jgi:hypothetical protein
MDKQWPSGCQVIDREANRLAIARQLLNKPSFGNCQVINAQNIF